MRINFPAISHVRALSNEADLNAVLKTAMPRSEKPRFSTYKVGECSKKGRLKNDRGIVGD